MKPYILFFDIDGTLVDEKTGKMSEQTREAVRRAKAKGHYTFINTGRSYAELNSHLLETGFDGIVCGCGTYIQYHGDVIFEHKLDTALCENVVKDIRQYHMDAILEGTEFIYCDKAVQNPKLLSVKEYYGEEIGKKIRFIEEEGLQFDKFCFWLNEESRLEEFIHQYCSRFEFIKREADFYEAIPLGYSKASGMKYLCAKLGVSKQHTMAFGDSTNDLSMLEYAGISIAMGNSNPILFDKVDDVTGSVQEEGIYQALKKYNMI